MAAPCRRRLWAPITSRLLAGQRLGVGDRHARPPRRRGATSAAMPAATASGPVKRCPVTSVAVHGRGRQVGRQQHHHALADGHAEVDLGHAPVAPVLAHHDAVVGAAQQRPGAEGVAVHRGHGDASRPSTRPQSRWRSSSIAPAVVAVGAEPLEVEAVAVEAVGAGGDEGERTVPAPRPRRGPRATGPRRRRRSGSRPSSIVTTATSPCQLSSIMPGAWHVRRTTGRYAVGGSPVGAPGHGTSLDAVADYRPPLRDIDFVLDHLVDLDALCELPAFSGLDPDTIMGVLDEYGRFVAEVVAPLNRVGDIEGSQHDPATNTVRTPDGLHRRLPAVRRRRLGRRAVPRRSTAAAGSRGSSASPCRS